MGRDMDEIGWGRETEEMNELKYTKLKIKAQFRLRLSEKAIERGRDRKRLTDRLTDLTLF